MDAADSAICHFPEHEEFVLQCRQAEIAAKRSGEKSIFWWRGYRSVVAPNLPRLTPEGIEVRLMNALQKVKRTNAETMVKQKKIYM